MAKMVRMVAPNGEVWEVHPDEVPLALANKGVPFGSPEHMARIGVPGPDAVAGTPPTVPIEGDSMARQIARGLGKSGLATGVGLAKMVLPRKLLAPQERDFLDNAGEFAEPAAGAEYAAKMTGDVGQFLIPGAVASKAGKLAEAGSMFTPTKLAMLKQLMLRGGAEAGTSGVINAAQGGDFTTGAAAGAAGAGVGAMARGAMPLVSKFVRTPAVKHITRTALGIGAGAGMYGYHTGTVDPATIAKYGAAATLLSPRVHRIIGAAAPYAARVGLGAGLQYDRPEPRHTKVRAKIGTAGNVPGAGHR